LFQKQLARFSSPDTMHDHDSHNCRITHTTLRPTCKLPRGKSPPSEFLTLNRFYDVLSNLAMSFRRVFFRNPESGRLSSHPVHRTTYFI